MKQFIHRPVICSTIVLLVFLSLANRLYSDSSDGVNYVMVDSVRFPDHVTIGDERVELRGAGKYEYWTFDVYCAAFYSDSSIPLAKMLEAENARQMTLHYLRTIKAEELAEITNEGFDINPSINKEKLRINLDKVNALYKTVNKNDECKVIYSKDEGMKIYLNNRLICTINDPEFAKFYFGIWVGPYSVDRKFSRILRGE